MPYPSLFSHILITCALETTYSDKENKAIELDKIVFLLVGVPLSDDVR